MWQLDGYKSVHPELDQVIGDQVGSFIALWRDFYVDVENQAHVQLHIHYQHSSCQAEWHREWLHTRLYKSAPVLAFGLRCYEERWSMNVYETRLNWYFVRHRPPKFSMIAPLFTEIRIIPLRVRRYLVLLNNIRYLLTLTPTHFARVCLNNSVEIAILGKK